MPMSRPMMIMNSLTDGGGGHSRLGLIGVGIQHLPCGGHDQTKVPGFCAFAFAVAMRVLRAS